MHYRLLRRIDFRIVPLVLLLMLISLLTISAYSVPLEQDPAEASFFTPMVLQQLRGFLLGFVVFLVMALFDYNKLREWTWVLYALMLLSLFGLFFTDPIQRVQRWYRLPWIGIGIQPSEVAKLVVIIALSWFLERRKMYSRDTSTALLALFLVALPFLLILKQPDLGTALVLLPVSLVMFYFGDLHPWLVRGMCAVGVIALLGVALIFSGAIEPQQIQPYVSRWLKAYQLERLNPNTHHLKAASVAIALGGVSGEGWRKSEFSGGGFLPTPYTDSVFPAFGEEFGFLGLVLVLFVYYTLIYFSFQVAAVAVDSFGRLLAAGLAVYLAIHVVLNVGMMCGFFPITGVPLPLLSYGNTSILVTMAALGLLQSIYCRRFMF